MTNYREIKILATILTAKVQARYRPATADEEPYALDDREAIIRVNDLLPFSELPDAAIILARIALEPEEGVASRWVPRADALNPDAEDDIETLAEIIARKAVAGYEPVPYYVVKELGRSGGMLESVELVDAVITPDEFTSDAVGQQVCDQACERLDEWNDDGTGLWWQTEPEELPLDDLPLADTETGKGGDQIPF
jgi:hypothetical protein